MVLLKVARVWEGRWVKRIFFWNPGGGTLGQAFRMTNSSAGGINLVKNYGALVPSIIRTLFALFREVAIVPCSCVVYIFWSLCFAVKFGKKCLAYIGHGCGTVAAEVTRFTSCIHTPTTGYCTI